MKKFRNKTITKQIGSRIKKLREGAGLSIPDIADMTGFSYPTISAIEKGQEVTASYLVEIAFAIGVHPKEIFDVDFVIKPRYKLSAKRKEKTRLTSRINDLLQSNFFSSPKFVKDVLTVLVNEYKTKTTASSISVILLRLVEQGALLKKKQGRQNLYFTKM